MKSKLLFLLIAVLAITTFMAFNVSSQERAQNKWEESIVAFEEWDAKNSTPQNAVLFIGSSSIRWWKTAELFNEFPVINRGFGGAQISDINYFYKRIVLPYKPKMIVFYCGGNDLLSAKKTPQQTFVDYRKFSSMVKKSLPKTKLVFLSVKPGPAHWDSQPLQVIREFNAMVEECSRKEETFYYLDAATGMLNNQGKPDPRDYQSDGVHLTYEADKKWAALLKPKLLEIYNQQ